MDHQKIELADGLKLSRIIHGHWRLNAWGLSTQELLTLTKRSVELGISSIDHADIYGDYSCEALFGACLALDSSLRSKLEIITKCGINLVSEKYPNRKLKTYDLSFDHIIDSVNNSLRNFKTDYIDVLLLHRPSPFYDPNEVARAFDQLHASGKVKFFGVSNFTPQQFLTLDAFVDQPLITNQIELSPYCLEHFDNGNIDFCWQQGIKPMAWSPLSGGRLFDANDETGKRIIKAINPISQRLEVGIDTVAIAWLLNHPIGILPIIGTGKWERMQSAQKALSISLSQEEWFSIYEASLGNEIP